VDALGGGEAHDVAKHDHFIAVLGEDGLIEHHIQILVVSLREEAHRLDVPGKIHVLSGPEFRGYPVRENAGRCPSARCVASTAEKDDARGSLRVLGARFDIGAGSSTSF
jgi:hypothetical protein